MGKKSFVILAAVLTLAGTVAMAKVSTRDCLKDVINHPSKNSMDQIDPSIQKLNTAMGDFFAKTETGQFYNANNFGLVVRDCRITKTIADDGTASSQLSVELQRGDQKQHKLFPGTQSLVIRGDASRSEFLRQVKDAADRLNSIQQQNI